MADEDHDEEPEESGLVSWDAVKAKRSMDPWVLAAYERMMMLERMLLHVCHARGVNEQIVMDALRTETTPEYVHDETFVPIAGDEDDERLYIALVGRALAAMGGHLELRAVFPEKEFLLLSEPGPEHMDDDVRRGPRRFTR